MVDPVEDTENPFEPTAAAPFVPMCLQAGRYGAPWEAVRKLPKVDTTDPDLLDPEVPNGQFTGKWLHPMPGESK